MTKNSKQPTSRLYFCDERGHPMLDLPFFWPGMEPRPRLSWPDVALLEQLLEQLLGPTR